jgi:hypothetical protein
MCIYYVHYCTHTRLTRAKRGDWISKVRDIKGCKHCATSPLDKLQQTALKASKLAPACSAAVYIVPLGWKQISLHWIWFQCELAKLIYCIVVNMSEHCRSMTTIFTKTGWLPQCIQRYSVLDTVYILLPNSERGCIHLKLVVLQQNQSHQ